MMDEPAERGVTPAIFTHIGGVVCSAPPPQQQKPLPQPALRGPVFTFTNTVSLLSGLCLDVAAS